MTLPAINRSALDENLAFRGNAYLPAISLTAHALSSHSSALDIEAKPDTDVLTLCMKTSLFSTELLIVCGGQQCIQGIAVCAGIIGRIGGSRVGERLLGDQVSPAHFNGVERKLMSNSVHRALDTIAGFWSSSSSIGAGGDSVGLHGVDNSGNRWDSIGARDHRGSRINAEDAIITRIATQVGKKLGLECQNSPVLANSGLHAGIESSAMIHRDDIVLATLQPSHRSLQLVRQKCRHDFFAAESGLAAKGSPHMWNSDLDVRRSHVQRHRQLQTSQKDRLTGDPDRE